MGGKVTETKEEIPQTQEKLQKRLRVVKNQKCNGGEPVCMYLFYGLTNMNVTRNK